MVCCFIFVRLDRLEEIRRILSQGKSKTEIEHRILNSIRLTFENDEKQTFFAESQPRVGYQSDRFDAIFHKDYPISYDAPSYGSYNQPQTHLQPRPRTQSQSLPSNYQPSAHVRSSSAVPYASPAVEYAPVVSNFVENKHLNLDNEVSRGSQKFMLELFSVSFNMNVHSVNPLHLKSVNF